MGALSLTNATTQAESKGENCWGGSLQDPWYAGLHPRTRAERALEASLSKLII